MKNLNCSKRWRQFAFLQKSGKQASKLRPMWSSALFFLALGLTPLSALQAQSHDKMPLRISSVSTQSSDNRTLISITADGQLRRAQTWQDNDGYHVIVPYASAQNSVKPSRGVKVRRIGQSLEILIQTKPGANVSARADDNHLNLTISGSLEPRAESAIDNFYQREEANLWMRPQDAKTAVEAPSVAPASALTDSSNSSSQFSSQPSLPSTKAGPPSLEPRPNNQLANQPTRVPAAPESEIALQPEDEGFFTSVFSSTAVIVIMVLGICGLIVSRRLRSRWSSRNEHGSRRKPTQVEAEDKKPVQSLQPAPQFAEPESQSRTPQANAIASRSTGSHMTVATPDSLYGEYRIDQEVGKLVLGQPHRMDVLSSRAPADRRAIEASLIKMIASSPDDNESRRASEALEEYGFVARQCANLLTAPDAFDRTTAARSLGEIKSPAALPFLLEGLYDSEPIVRNQAVASIGELKVPRAIGALLDMARRHPEVPGNLVSKALSACSVEGLDFFDAPIHEPAQLGDGSCEGFGSDIPTLEPAAAVEDLPLESEDEGLTPALIGVRSESASERLESAKDLARHQAQSAVSALTALARLDADSSVRAQAISSLALINHESVFPAVLIGMADESREVRAAAARSLSHLSFDRTDAYIRVLETNDEDLLPEVASACIQAGIVSQGIDRLSSGDKRQAYETFSIISLLARAKLTDPIVETIANHPNLDVRLAVLRLLANTGEPEIFEQLRLLALRDGLGEELHTALLEAMYKLDQSSGLANSDEQTVVSVPNSKFSDANEAHAIAAEPYSAIEGPGGEFEL